MFIALMLAGSLAASAAAQPAPGPGGPPPAGARPAGPPRAALPGPEPIEHIVGNVYKIFGGGGNTLVIVQHDGVVLVDTKLPGNGPAIMEQVRTVTNLPVKLIISTHSHPDHIGSTDYLRQQFPNVRIIMNEGGKAEITSAPNFNPALVPTETYTDHMSIGEGDERLELYHTGRGHTNGDTFVVVPSAHLLFMGDVMAWNMAPFLPAGGAMAITEELEKLVATVKDVDIVVEGHGYVNNWAGLVLLTRFHRALITAARAAYDRGDPPGAAVAELERNPEWGPLLNHRIKKGLEYGNTPFARANMNVNIAYAEFAGEPVGFAIANGGPLPATDKHKGSNPADTAPPTPEMLAAATRPDRP